MKNQKNFYISTKIGHIRVKPLSFETIGGREMKKYNRETLTMCVLEDDRKLSDYAGNQLEEIEYEIPDICMSVKRIPDTTIMKLYHTVRTRNLFGKQKNLQLHIISIISMT